MLFLYTKDAIGEYSRDFPRRVDRATVVATGGVYALPSDYIEDIYVECPLDTYLTRREIIPGKIYTAQGTPSSYYVSGGNIYFDATPTDTVLLTYFAEHAMPAAVDDTEFAFTMSDSDVNLLIRFYVKAVVHLQMRAKQSRLDRFKSGSGQRDDNPLMPETVDMMAEYNQRVANKLSGGVIKLYRPK
jgi:hypothetical protein